MNELIRIGVDLAKNVFQVHGVDRRERPAWCKRLPRERWLQAVAETAPPGCEIGMESCGGAHHWARQLQARGFCVKLTAPQFVKPYVKSNKNDANDAEAICEAMSRPCMRFVSVKWHEALVGACRINEVATGDCEHRLDPAAKTSTRRAPLPPLPRRVPSSETTTQAPRARDHDTENTIHSSRLFVAVHALRAKAWVKTQL
jgi:hypothetical protein